MNESFDPKKIIDFNKDYYSILGIDKNDLPKKFDRDSKVKSSKIIEEAFRKKARTCHPDFGGSKDSFLDLVRARRILEDSILKKIYDQGYFDDFKITSLETNFEIDWSKVGTYRKGTLEDTIGFKLFLKISDMKLNLGLIPAFFPQDEQHNYEWDWIIENSNMKLVLSLVSDEEEVLRLSNGTDIDKSFPFKIYLCIPKANLNLIRSNENYLDPHGRNLMQAKINKVQYNDFDLLETTDLQKAIEYIENNLQKDLIHVKNGTYENNNKSMTKWLDSESLNNFDKNLLNNIINFKYFNMENNKNAGDFLDDLE